MDEDIFRLDYGENPDLQAAVGGLTTGDTLTVTLELTVRNNDTENTSLETSISEISVLPADDEEETSTVPSAEQPVMAVMIRNRSDGQEED